MEMVARTSKKEKHVRINLDHFVGVFCRNHVVVEVPVFLTWWNVLQMRRGGVAMAYEDKAGQENV